MLRSTRHLCHYQLLVLFYFNTLLTLAASIPTDSPPTLNILHYHHASTANLTTRATSTSRLMSNCPVDLEYFGSLCRHDRSLQAVMVACRKGLTTEFHNESCGHKEICIDLELREGPSEAYCVAAAAWRRVMRSSIIRPGMHNLLTAEAWAKIDVPQEGGEPVQLRAAQARLLGSFTPILLEADYIVLAAYRDEEVEHEPVRRLTADDDCKECFSVSMWPVPQGTSILRAKVIAPQRVADLGGASLYLFTVE